MVKPLITIAVPSFNQGQFLDDALESIFSQKVPVEVFVLDGGSSDNSIDVIKKWESYITWWRSRADDGQSEAINEGIAMGSAPYVCWLNADDRFSDNGLKRLLKGLEMSGGSPVAYGRCWTTHSTGKKIIPYLTLPFSSWLLANFCFIAQPATLIRRNVWEKVGGIDRNLSMAMDYDLWWRVYKQFGKFKYIRDFVAETRMHSETKTTTRREDHYSESMETVLRHYGRIPLKWHIAWPIMVRFRSFLNRIKDRMNFDKSIVNDFVSFLGRKTRVFQPAFVSCKSQHLPRPLRRIQPHSVKLPANPPLISIVIPSLNQGRFLETAIKSILDQNYPNLQLIVVDGGSIDGSKEIIEKYSDRLSWWCSEQDKGQTNALNKGFARAAGDILAWLNADDCHLPQTLRIMADFMTYHPNVDAIYGHRILIDENGLEIGQWILPSHSNSVLSWADFIPQETLFWRRSLWEKIGASLDESFDFAMDWDLLLRYRNANARMVRLPNYLGLFRIHSQQKTSAQIEETGFREMQALRSRSLGYKPSQLACALGVSVYLIKGYFIELLWKAGVISYE